MSTGVVLDAGAFIALERRDRTMVVLLARLRGWSVLTSDAGDLLAIDPTLVVERI
jgi:hypothetical protein